MRLHAKSVHPTYKKLDRLIKFLQDELKLEVSFYSDRIFIKDMEIPKEKDWEIVNLSGDFVNELPTVKYKLARDIEHDAPRKHSLSMVPKNMQYEIVENN